MRILYLTAGAAGMYCGSCLRDNALATELLAHGHEVTLVPLYTPTLTDERNVSQDKVFFGGISVYLQQHSPIFRITPRAIDRLWDSNFALKMVARRSIPVQPESLGELTVSMLRGEDGNQKKELGKLIDWARTQPPPDVIDLQNSLLIGLAKSIRRSLNRPVCCTLQGEDLFLAGLQEPSHTQAIELIRANVKHVDAFIAVSDYYAGFMSELLSIPREKMHVVKLGINLKDFGSEFPARRPKDRFNIGYLARVAPEKGLHMLAQAYRLFRKQEPGIDARLEVAGYLGPEHSGYLRTIERQLQESGLTSEFRYRGAVDREEKMRFLSEIDVLSIPATYDEPKGLPVLEAMASGVPVVQPRRGSFSEIIERTGGGLLVEPDDPAALAEGLLSLWRNPELGEELAKQGYSGVRAHYAVSNMTERALEVYGSLLGKQSEAAGVAMAETK
jgi:glycosyltransferase involved in cell wall biosynthesis